MFFIKQLLIGTIIGGGMILPGVSGGVLAVALGIYEQLLETIAHFFKDIKKNMIFLIPLIIGLIIGVLLFGKVLYFVFDKYPMEAKYAFMGLILGALPVLFKELEKKGDKKLKLSSFAISCSIALILFILGRETLNINFSNNIDSGIISFVLLFITGLIFIAGKIIPGISSSFMLMLIGMYQFLLNILNDPLGLSKEQYIQIIPFVLGILVGAICLVKVINYLIKNFFSHTYSAIIGFVIGSIAAIYPGFEFGYRGIISLSLFAISFLISYKFSSRDYKRSKN